MFIGKSLLYIIENSVDISGNSIIDTILFAIIGGISFSIAFGLVGRIFDKLGVYDSDLMSDTHWLIRVIVFIVLTHVFVLVAQVIKWIFSFQWWIYLIAFLMLIGIVVLAYYIKLRISKRKQKKMEATIEQEKQEDCKESELRTEHEKIATDRYHCPRCHSRLVKRHGPYGDFYGCESYGQTGCRYTRKCL